MKSVLYDGIRLIYDMIVMRFFLEKRKMMLIESITLPKEKLTTVSEEATLAEALTILEESGFRCIPILDKSGTIFRGNIYKMHIYRHKANGGSLNIPVTDLLKNATKYISIDSSFFKVFFTIKELPYIAVLDKQKHFYGILTHSSMLGLLEKSWDVQTGHYAMTVAYPGQQQDLAVITKIITRYVPISSCITLNPLSGNKQQTLFTLPASTTPRILEKVTHRLSKKGYTVTAIENLQLNQKEE